MIRNILLGAIAFGLPAALAGYVWSAFEFPFALLLPGVVGWLVLAWSHGTSKAAIAALVGGIAFTAAFMVGMFFAITDGSPLAVPAWLAAAAAAAAAGAIVGALLGGRSAAVRLALFSALGMFVGEVLAWAAQYAVPGSVDTPGTAQLVYMSVTVGVVGVAVGAFVGYAMAAIEPAKDSAA